MSIEASISSGSWSFGPKSHARHAMSKGMSSSRFGLEGFGSDLTIDDLGMV